MIMSKALLMTIITPLLLTFYISLCLVIQRKNIASMTSMTITMTVGMMNGLLSGVIFGVFFNGNLFLSTVLGMGVGFICGSMVGLLNGIIPVLNGMLSGLMGGMMGAMLGEMVMVQYQESTIKIFFTLVIVSLILALNLLNDETQKPFTQPFNKMLEHPIASAIILIGFFYIYNNMGLIVNTESLQVDLDIEHNHIIDNSGNVD
ncbi:hypothetical protein V1503_03095 [Bacillus sp. SCS-151]|uniref:hypothetical protein n=1 Tax=Nanhaiella sioensis TaxID=3115293 RepID=UPI00397D944E